MEFETFTDDSIKLRNWLLEKECPVVAMESTGPYWTPIHNILEGYFQVILVNPKHMKNVPGRKTDISDSRWLAGLLRQVFSSSVYSAKISETVARFDSNEKELYGDRWTL